MGFGVIIIPIILVLIAAGAYYSYVQKKKRFEEMWALASELGWQFDPNNDYEFGDRYPDFEIFHQGHSQYAYNTLAGSIGVGGVSWPAQMGDFHYQVTSSNGKQTTTHTYLLSYLMVQLPFVGVPELLIRREGMFDAVKSMFGFDDIDFESAEFSRRFFVKSPDKRFAYGVIDARMMEFMLANEAPAVHIQSGRCCLSDGSGTWTAEEFRANFAWARQFFELWPAHVTSQLQQQ